MKTIDLKVNELCNEIDYYKEMAEFWKTKYDDLNKEYNLHINSSLKITQQGVANALMFALAISDDEEGNLVIPKEKRQDLANNYKN